MGSLWSLSRGDKVPKILQNPATVRSLSAHRPDVDWYVSIDGDAEHHERIRKLIALRRIYGDFFVIPERVLRLMRSDRCRDGTDHCMLRDKSFTFNASGQPKGKCVMGDATDCDRCGCVVPFYLRSLTDRRLILEDLGSSSIRALRATITLSGRYST